MGAEKEDGSACFAGAKQGKEIGNGMVFDGQRRAMCF